MMIPPVGAVCEAVNELSGEHIPFLEKGCCPSDVLGQSCFQDHFPLFQGVSPTVLRQINNRKEQMTPIWDRGGVKKGARQW